MPRLNPNALPNAQCPILAVGTVPRWHDCNIISQDSQSGPLDIHRNDEQDRVYNLSAPGVLRDALPRMNESTRLGANPWTTSLGVTSWPWPRPRC